jgi:hypothetical protein
LIQNYLNHKRENNLPTGYTSRFFISL